MVIVSVMQPDTLYILVIVFLGKLNSALFLH